MVLIVVPVNKERARVVIGHFGTSGARESDVPRCNDGNTTHDDWPARMILG
jgi:hypothetical protein